MEKQTGNSDRQMPSTSLASSSAKSIHLSERYGDRERFLMTFNPDLQVRAGGDADRCLFGDTPTLSEVNNAYGSETSSMWLVLQLNSLSEFCGCKDKLTGGALKECSMLISREYYYLKVSEMLLFFYQFKCGKYGKFYGSVDPLAIMTALKEFCEYRNTKIARKESEEASARRAEERKEHITHEQWEEMKKKMNDLYRHTKSF